MLSNPFQIEAHRLAFKDILNSLISNVGMDGDVQGALLDSKGELIEVCGTNPLHFPVFEACLKSIRKYLTLRHGDVIATNDPYSGNTRLCDLLLVQGAFGKSVANELRYYVALQVTWTQLLNKPTEGIPQSIEDEGYRIPPTQLNEGKTVNPQILQYLAQSGAEPDKLAAFFGRCKEALNRASQEIIDLEQNSGRESLARSIDGLRKYSDLAMQKALHEIPDGEYMAHEILENDGVDKHPLRIQCHLTVHGNHVLLSFQGTSKQVRGPFNCNHTLTLGACFWVLRSLVSLDIPVNSGLFRAFSLEAPEGTLVNARYPGALLGGYFETTKRIADTLGATMGKALPLGFHSQSGGSSNPVFFRFGNRLLLEQTAAGGSASKDAAGADCVQANLHNTPSRSIEEIEKHFPLQVTHSGIRDASGGDGRLSGGSGITRGYKFLDNAQVSLLADRKSTKARGIFGGVSGLQGETIVIPQSDKRKIITDKCVLNLTKGDVLIVNTPGGGGWGKKDDPEATQ